jgi:hypothetical protein
MNCNKFRNLKIILKNEINVVVCLKLFVLTWERIYGSSIAYKRAVFLIVAQSQRTLLRTVYGEETNSVIL